jgi:DNA-binding winged helix-turn-helix (wHTH) protein
VSHDPGVAPRPLSTFAFGRFELDSALLELRCGGKRVPVGPKAFAFLHYLLTHRDRVVSRVELFEKLWPGVRVGDAALRSVVHEARAALGDSDASEHRIRTLHGRGYRFVDQVVERGPAGPAREPAPRSPGASDFVDREVELDLLRAALRAAHASERQVVLLHGPPGIGKTRTALEMAREAADAGFEVHVSRGQEAGGAPPYWPWIQLLRSWADGLAAQDPDRATSAHALRSTLGDWIEPGVLPNVRDAESTRFLWLDSVTRLIREVSELRPQLLVLDDLHWADDASIRLLIFVVQQLPRARLLVLGTHRELASSHPLGQVLREPGTRSVRLAGMDRHAVELILERALDHPPTRALIERVHAASGGNPLFVAELVRYVSTHPASAAASGRLPVPARLRDAIWTRLSECSEGCRRVLRVASVAGAACSLSLLRRVVGGDSGELLESLGEAEQRDLLIDMGSFHDFSHGVIREVIYEELSPIDRIHLHESVGEALERLCVPDPSRNLAALAHHFVEAAVSQPDRALHYARRAAQNAAGSFAYREAMALYRSALGALEYIDPADPAQRCALLIELGEVTQFAGEARDRFLEAFMEAIRLARAAQLTALLGRAAERCVVHLSARGELLPYAEHRGDPLVDDLRAALETAACDPAGQIDAELHAGLHMALAIVQWAMHEPRRSHEAIQIALRIGAASGNAALHGEILQQQAEIGLLFDADRERLVYPDRLLALARQSARLDLEAHACMAQLVLAVERGDRDGVERAGRLVERIEQERPLWAASPAQSWSVLCALLDGRLEDAQRAMSRAVEEAMRRQLHEEWTTAAASTYIWWTCLLRGTSGVPAASLESYIAARRVAPVLPIFDILLARSHAELGRTEQASRLLDGLGALLQDLPRGSLWLICASVAAEVCALCRRPEHAELLLELLEPYATRVVMIGEFMCLGSVSRPLGSLAALLERWDEAESYFEHALDHASGLRAPILAALAQLDQARALVHHPERAPRLRATALAEGVAISARAFGLAGVEQQAERVVELAKRPATTKLQRISHAIPTTPRVSRS